MTTQRDAALALLNLDPVTTRLTRKAGSFLRAGLPALNDGGTA